MADSEALLWDFAQTYGVGSWQQLPIAKMPWSMWTFTYEIKKKNGSCWSSKLLCNGYRSAKNQKIMKYALSDLYNIKYLHPIRHDLDPQNRRGGLPLGIRSRENCAEFARGAVRKIAISRRFKSLNTIETTSCHLRAIIATSCYNSTVWGLH